LLDLVDVRLLVDAPLAAQHELETLDGIREIDRIPLDARIDQRVSEHAPGGAYERAAGDVFLVPGLFPHDEEPCGRGSFARHRGRAELT
jgi:hypothetical protein